MGKMSTRNLSFVETPWDLQACISLYFQVPEVRRGGTAQDEILGEVGTISHLVAAGRSAARMRGATERIPRRGKWGRQTERFSTLGKSDEDTFRLQSPGSPEWATNRTESPRRGCTVPRRILA